ncbi:MAG: hypothetical protein AAGF47_12565 [Planctomycetota bacterium]
MLDIEERAIINWRAFCCRVRWPVAMYTPTDIVIPWSRGDLDYAGSMGSLRRIRKEASDRADAILDAMGMFQADRRLYEGEVPLDIGVIESTDQWIDKHTAVLPDKTIDIIIEKEAPARSRRVIANKLTASARAIMVDLGILFAQVVLHNCPTMKWKVTKYKNTPHEIVLSNPVSRYEHSPWRQVWGAVSGVVEANESHHLLRSYAVALQQPPLK